MKRLLEIMSQCDVVQTDFPESLKLEGINEPRLMKIYINKNQTTHSKLNTLIHESLHIYYSERELNRTEKQIITETNEIMRNLYGDEYEI